MDRQGLPPFICVAIRSKTSLSTDLLSSISRGRRAKCDGNEKQDGRGGTSTERTRDKICRVATSSTSSAFPNSNFHQRGMLRVQSPVIRAMHANCVLCMLRAAWLLMAQQPLTEHRIQALPPHRGLLRREIMSWTPIGAGSQSISAHMQKRLSNLKVLWWGQSALACGRPQQATRRHQDAPCLHLSNRKAAMHMAGVGQPKQETPDKCRSNNLN